MVDLKQILDGGKLGLQAVRLKVSDNEQVSRFLDYVEDVLDVAAIGGEAFETFAANSGEALAEVDRVIAAGGATREDFETNTRSIDEITARLIARQEAAKQG